MDYAAPGLKIIDKLIDKHWDKIPTRAFHPDHPVSKTAHIINPRSIRKSHRNKYAGFGAAHSNSRSPSPNRSPERSPPRSPERSPSPFRSPSPSPPPSYVESEDPEMEIASVQRRSTMPPQFSREPPRLRPEYIPPPPMGQNAWAPEPPGLARARAECDRHMEKSRREWEESQYLESQYLEYQRPRRPKAVTRRSSSYPAYNRRRYDSPESRSGSGSEAGPMSRREELKDRAHRYGLKDETIGRLGTTPAGITGGVFGAVAGGWAAKQAQVAVTGAKLDEGRKRDQIENKALTLLGAAVGGLVANAAVERWQRGRREDANEKQRVWEEKHGRNESRGSSNYKKERNRRQSESGRSSRDRYDNDGTYSGNVEDWVSYQSARGRRDESRY